MRFPESACGALLGMITWLGAGFVTPAPAQQRPASTTSTTRVEQLDRAQFAALPDDQPIEIRGKRTTKAELRAAAQKAAADARSRAEAAAKQAQARERAEADAFRRGEDTRIERENAKIRTQAAREGQEPPGRERLRAEARQLRERAAHARTEAEHAAIHQRAQELLAQLERE